MAKTKADPGHLSCLLPRLLLNALDEERDHEAESARGVRPTVTAIVATLLNEALAARAKQRSRAR